jgi:hypothetical protein
VYVEGKDGAVWQTYWSGRWSAPNPITPAGSISGGVAAIVFDNRQDVFWTKQDGSIWESCYPCGSGGWGAPFQVMGIGTTQGGGDISALSTSANEQLYWPGYDNIQETFRPHNDVWRIPYTIVTLPHGQHPIGGIAAVQGFNIDVYATSTDSTPDNSNTKVWETYWPVNNGWNPPFPITSGGAGNISRYEASLTALYGNLP